MYPLTVLHSCTALDKIKVTANHVNEAQREAESRSKIVEIQNRVIGDFQNLLSPSRKFIRE